MTCVSSHLYLQWVLDVPTGFLVPRLSTCPLNQVKQPSSRVPHWKCFSAVSLQQLRANVREMEKLCTRVRAEDADALEALVKPVRDRASAAARDFLLLHSNPAPWPAPATPPGAQPSSCVSSSCHADDNMCEQTVSGRQIQLQLPEIPPDQSAAESWDNLEEVWEPHTEKQPGNLLFNNYFELIVIYFSTWMQSLLLDCCYGPFFLYKWVQGVQSILRVQNKTK